MTAQKLGNVRKEIRTGRESRTKSQPWAKHKDNKKKDC
jgi:hypothetical protein